MERSSPTPSPIDYTATPPVNPSTAEREPEVKALNKSLRRAESEKKIPDEPATQDRYQSKSIASLHSSSGVPVSQKNSEFIMNERVSSGQPHATTSPITKKSMQELPKPEQPATAAFKDKRLFFEQKLVGQQTNTNKPAIESYRSSHSSTHDYKPCNVSAENQWMTDTNHYSHHTPAPWEQERNKATPKPLEGMSSLPPSHLKTAASASTHDHTKTRSDERARQEQEQELDALKALAELDQYLEQLNVGQENSSD